MFAFIFKEVAHACSPGEDELGDIFDDLGLVFGRKGSEPFCKALLWEILLLTLALNDRVGDEVRTTLPCRDRRMR